MDSIEDAADGDLEWNEVGINSVEFKGVSRRTRLRTLLVTIMSSILSLLWRSRCLLKAWGRLLAKGMLMFSVIIRSDTSLSMKEVYIYLPGLLMRTKIMKISVTAPSLNRNRLGWFR